MVTININLKKMLKQLKQKLKQDSETKGGAYLEMELHEGENSEVIADNDTAREGIPQTI